jgi:hypothetical protein
MATRRNPAPRTIAAGQIVSTGSQNTAPATSSASVTQRMRRGERAATCNPRRRLPRYRLPGVELRRPQVGGRTKPGAPSRASSWLSCAVETATGIGGRGFRARAAMRGPQGARAPGRAARFLQRHRPAQKPASAAAAARREASRASATPHRPAPAPPRSSARIAERPPREAECRRGSRQWHMRRMQMTTRRGLGQRHLDAGFHRA